MTSPSDAMTNCQGRCGICAPPAPSPDVETLLADFQLAIGGDSREAFQAARTALLAAFAAQARRTEEAEGLTRADTERLRQAEERVWPGMTHGCDAPEWMADEIIALRQEKAELQQRLAAAESDALREVGKQWQALNDEQFDHWLYVTKGVERA